MMDDVILLIKQTMTTNDAGDVIPVETTRTVFCERKSIGLKRQLQADEAGLKLAFKFVLKDEYDYDGESICAYNGTRYNIVNVFIPENHTVELTTARY